MRRELEYRPLLALAAGLVAGLSVWGEPWLLVLAAPFLLIRRSWVPLVLGLGVGFAMARHPAPVLERREFAQTVGTVTSVPRISTGRISFRLRAGEREWLAALDGCPDVALGDELEFVGVARPLRDGVDGPLRLQGIAGRMEISRWARVARGGSLARAGEGWRRSYRATLERGMPAADAALTESVGLDLDGTLDQGLRDRLRATGTVHIVSASGLHVFILAGFVMGVLSLVPIPRGGQILVLAAVLVLYAIATGLDAPVIRSALMALVGTAAYLVGRERDALSALALAAVAYLVWRPAGVFDVGFQLSFVTVGGLILFGPREREAPTILSLVVDAVRVSWVAFVASAPLLGYVFGSVSLVSVPANLFVGLPVSCLVVGGLVAHLLGFAFPAVGSGLLVVVGWLSAYVRAVVDWLGALPFAQVEVPAFPMPVLIAVYAALVLLWRPRIVQAGAPRSRVSQL